MGSTPPPPPPRGDLLTLLLLGKLTKSILVAKTLEAFKPKAKFFPLKISISKTCSKLFFV